MSDHVVWLSLAIMATGYIILIYQAFNESLNWGLACLFFTPTLILFIITRLYKTKRAVLIVIFGLSLLIYHAFQSPAEQRESQFAGTWNVVLSGSLSGGGQVNINKAGSIFFQPVVLQDNRVELTGHVYDSGKLAHGTIFKDHSQIGTLSGNFSGNNGGGTYQLDNGGFGNWSADKQ